MNAAIPVPFQQSCVAGNCPIALLPRLQASIDAHYPGTRLAIGEYWYGRGGDISAAITNADFLGILARAGVYSAAMWWNASNIWAYNVPNGCNNNGLCTTNAAYKCALLAIDVFQDYDGAGAKAGDTFVDTTVTDPGRPVDPTRSSQTYERVTAYATVDAADPTRLVMVLLNKTLRGDPIDAAIRVTHTERFNTAEVWRVTGTNDGPGGCTKARQADLPITLTNALNASLPPQSITLLVLKP